MTFTFKVPQGQSDGVIGSPIYGFVLVLSSNIWPKVAPLQYTCSLQSLSHIAFER